MKLKVLLIFTILSLALFWPIFLGKVNLNGNLLVSFYAPYGQNLPFKNTGWDQLRIYFPFYKITFDSFKNFSMPLWNPYAFSGHPHMADFQTAVFYPLNIFGLFLSQIAFWHMLRVTPMILAAFFTFVYLKNLKLSNLSSFFGALTFGFSPFILTWGEEVVMSPHSIVWLPLILFAIDRFLQTKKKIFLTIITLAFASSFLGGYMQTTIYLAIFVFLYLIFRLRKNLFLTRFGLLLLGACVLGALIAAIQLLPSAELFFLGARSQVRLTSTLIDFLLPIEAIVTFLAPDFFGHPATGNFFRRGPAQYYEGIMFIGIAALIFALFAIFAERQKTFPKEGEKLIKFFAIFAIVSLSTTIDLPTARIYLMLPIPLLSSSIANRILFVPAFCLSILAAIGFDLWRKTRNREIFKIIFVLTFALAAIVYYLFGVKFLHFPYEGISSLSPVFVSARNLVIPFGEFALTAFLIFVASYRQKYKMACTLLICTLAFFHIFYFSQKYFSFSDKKNIFPENPILAFIAKNQNYNRSWGIGKGYFETNFASQYGIFWPGGYDSLNNKSYGEFTFSGKDADISQFIFRADAGLVGKEKISEFLRDDKRRIADILGVKYLISYKDDFELLSKNNFAKVYEAGDFGVFENLQALPRAYLVSNYEGPPLRSESFEGQVPKELDKISRKLIPQKLLADDFDFRNALILEKPSPISPQFGQGTADIVSYKPNEVIVKTKSDEPKLLFLSDNYYPGWKAEVDGNSVDILRADYTFRAVPLVAGEHLVRFFYESLVFRVGVLLSLVALSALFFLTLVKNRLTG